MSEQTSNARRRHPSLALHLVLCVLTAAVLGLVGCGSDATTTGGSPPIPRRVPPDTVGVVGTVPITKVEFDHWLPLAGRSLGHSRARAATLTFLLKAQWLMQEADAEGVDHRKLERLVSRSVRPAPPGSGLTRADQAFRVRLDLIAEALQQKHHPPRHPVTGAEVAAYYAANRGSFRAPALRETKMVVTHTRRAARRAQVALRNESWAAVAKRFSIDSSAAVGGRYAIVRGLQSPVLVRAAFRAERGRLVGPLRAKAAASSDHYFYLFRVTKEVPGRQRPLSESAPQIRQVLEERGRRRALTAYEDAFVRRWRARTLCAPGYLVPQCRNFRVKSPVSE